MQPNELPFEELSISLDGVSKHYQGRDALLDMDLQIPKDGAYFVTGPSGAGKSTLLRLMALLEAPNRGRVYVEGVDTHKIGNAPLLRLRKSMSFVFQSPHLLFDRNAYDNVALPLFIKGCSKSEIERRVETALHAVGMLPRAAEFPDNFSAGEQERLSIARALVSRPRILFADEPTGNLDPDLSLEVMRLLCAMPARGTTVVIATHDTGLLDQFSHVPVIEIAAGRLVRNGIAEQKMREQELSGTIPGV